MQIIDFLAADGIDLDGKSVADVGSGDGSIALGIAHRAPIDRVVGYDLRLTDTRALRERATRAGAPPPPHNMFFVESEPEFIPAESDSFDVVISWSVLEHVANPVAILDEVRRILTPNGVAFLQVWPLFPSEHGGHLWRSGIPEPDFVHLRHRAGAIARELHGQEGTYPGFSAQDEWETLNGLTLDDLQRSILAAELLPTKVEIISSPVHLSRELMRYRLSDLTIGGVKMLVVPRSHPGVSHESTYS